MSQHHTRKFKKILVANRGEIAIRILRALTELNIRTIAIYSHEDRYSLHRYKADEAYQIGEESDPLKPYLDIENIINLAKQKGAEAIHPGYGFLSENDDFVRRCDQEGIVFIGPTAEVMDQLGDKVKAKEVAKAVGVPLIPDSDKELNEVQDAIEEASRIGYPVMLKAASGGGGRGMRVIRSESEIKKAFIEARREAKNAFGDETVFLEKFVENPKHIEVQILGDNYGNIIHLFERDCSVQRRFQKVVEVAPSTLPQETREEIYDYAMRLAKHVGYNNAGTAEFLVDQERNVYFIEVNPRVQVEHTITEEITGIDIVRSQILIAAGAKLSDPQIFIKSQEDVRINGFAIQCRITTEDPAKNFKPDYGRILAYRNAGGFGIRIDEGSAYPGARISPFFDSMLVKVSAWGRSLKGASQRMERALKEFRIRGVKDNIPFLLNVMDHSTFQRGEATVGFIQNHPDLLDIRRTRDRATKTLRYLGNILVNGNPNVKHVDPDRKFRPVQSPYIDRIGAYPEGTKTKLEQLGRDKFLEWLKAEKRIQITDTTFRDAHQSLLATRMRTMDMYRVAQNFARSNPELFSMEVWGGATFDVCMRFLKEDPWRRLEILREQIPNILFQMLLRGSNAVGYKGYPDNLVIKFIEKAAETGIDIFRIFDSLNWLEAMKVSIKTVRENTNSIAEACICYTGDILDPARSKYTLQYYVDLAKQLEDAGAHILAIKDMAGLLKPFAAEKLVAALKESVDLPIHLHTHDTSGNQLTTYLKAMDAGVDIVDLAIGSMSGLTSQPNMNSFLAMTEGHPRAATGLNQDTLETYSAYWERVRERYYPFETELKASSAEIYKYEIPGGQYSNLRPQARSLGLEEKFETVKQNYAIVNRMFGDIVKVTPSSKVVGDMALFMTANELSEADVMTRGNELSFPESVKSFFRGELGQPYQGFPADLQKIILKDEKPFTERPNAHLEAIDFDEAWKEFQEKYPDPRMRESDLLSSLLYPAVFDAYYQHLQQYDEVMKLPTSAFFYPLKANEEVLVTIDKGKKLLIQYFYMTEPNKNGIRRVFFRLNGQNRAIDIKDHSVNVQQDFHQKAEKENEIGAPLQGRLSKILVEAGAEVAKNQPLFVIEAMKMESTVTSPFAGKVKKVHLPAGTMVMQEDMVVEMG